MNKIDIMAIAFACSSLLNADETRLKDLVNIKGVRSNYLIGYGLVTGLAGTGDSPKSLFTRKAVANMLTRLGIGARKEDVSTGNLASVVVTADLPPFSRNGDQLDIRISATGDSKSLAGGTLLRTPLTAGNGEIYAVAQGPIVIGKLNDSSAAILTVARVPQGAMVERDFIPRIVDDGSITVILKKPDFTTNYRIVQAVNGAFRGFYAKSLDLNTIAVRLPPAYKDQTVDFIAKLEELKITADTRAVVVLNERTGTVVLGDDISLSPVTIAHGDLSIKVEGTTSSNGKAAKGADTSIVRVKKATIGGLVETLNALGVKPQDLVGILQAMHAAGALKGDLEFI